MAADDYIGSSKFIGQENELVSHDLFTLSFIGLQAAGWGLEASATIIRI